MPLFGKYPAKKELFWMSISMIIIGVVGTLNMFVFGNTFVNVALFLVLILYGIGRFYNLKKGTFT